MSEIVSVKDIKKQVNKTKKLDDREIEFCRWYSGAAVDSFGSASELDAVESAKRAGFPQLEAEAFRDRVRTDVALQMQIAVFNHNRRGETMSRLQSYARRSADIMMDLADNAETESVRLGAAKHLMHVGGIGESPEEAAQRRKQTDAVDQFNRRLDALQDILGKKEVTYQPFQEMPVDKSKLIDDEKPEEDDDIVG
jgi:hypothetical protein